MDMIQISLHITNPKHFLKTAGDDDDFGGVRMEKVLAERRRVKDVFDFSE